MYFIIAYFPSSFNLITPSLIFNYQNSSIYFEHNFLVPFTKCEERVYYSDTRLMDYTFYFTYRYNLT